MTAVKTAQKFFSEDKDRSFESKVCNDLDSLILLLVSDFSYR